MMYATLGITSPPHQVAAGEVSDEPGSLVGPFGQVGHLLGGLARLVVEPGLKGRADGYVLAGRIACPVTPA